MPEMLEITLRSVFAFIFLLLLARLLGKRQLSQLNFFDYITGITIGSIAASLSSNPSTRIPTETAAIAVWAGLSWLIAQISMRSMTFRYLVQGKPDILIQQGEILRRNMSKNRYNLDDLLMQLREKDVFSLSEVETAVLETGGSLSVQKKAERLPLTPAVAGITVADGGKSGVVILDGKIMPQALKKTGRDERWLMNELNKQGISDVKDVFVAQISASGGVFVDRIDDFKTNWHPQSNKSLLATLMKAEADLEIFAMDTENPKAQQLYKELVARVEKIRKKAEPYLV